MVQKVQVHSSNRVRVLIDDKVVGLIQSVRASDDYAPEMASGVGDIHAQEYVPTVARHSIAVGLMVLRKDSLIQLGLQPKNGDEALRGIEVDIAVYDFAEGATPTLLRKYVGCSFANGDVDITKHAIIAQNATYLCRDVQGEFDANEIQGAA
jgi:hypothetical protein